MFNPSQEDVRRFFCAVYAKSQNAQPMDAIETLAGQWIAEHPQYHADLGDEEAAISRVYAEGSGQTNPFLHLSMHLSISEQCSIDQPRGIRQAAGGRILTPDSESRLPNARGREYAAISANNLQRPSRFNQALHGGRRDRWGPRLRHNL